MEKHPGIGMPKTWRARLVLVAGFFLVVAVLAILMLLYLVTAMPGRSLAGPLPPASASQAALAGRLQNHVQLLAGVIGPRNEGTPDSLGRAAGYIEGAFTRFGYTPESSFFGDGRFRNITVTLPGTDPGAAMLVLGAHYDTAPTGTPGADDNASGVAVLLEIARALSGMELVCTVRLITFPNEERPYFNTELMGSRVSAAAAAAAGDSILGMFSLEMLGYYSGAPDSQQYPPVIRNFYPATGNFVAFAGNMRSRRFLQQAVGAFREQGMFPSEGMAVPETLVRDVRRSDNASYWDYGYPAVMVTDTANFRNALYHTPADTPDTLDYTAMARVTEGLTGMVISLANTVK